MVLAWPVLLQPAVIDPALQAHEQTHRALQAVSGVSAEPAVWLLTQADKVRVKDYIHRLDNFDGPAVGEIAVGYEMFEEAFEIYKKFSLKSQAIKVLLDHMDDLPRALDYAIKVRCRVLLSLQALWVVWVLLGGHIVQSAHRCSCMRT